MKTIVLYFSSTGNNRFLAKKLAQDLNADTEEIRPVINVAPLLIAGLSFGNKKLQNNLENYSKIIVCSPVYMGKLAVPVKQLLKKINLQNKKVVFITCCGTNEKNKNEKFGYENVFQEIKAISHHQNIHCEALSVSLLLPENKRGDNNLVMALRLNEENFQGEIKESYQNILRKIQSI